MEVIWAPPACMLATITCSSAIERIWKAASSLLFCDMVKFWLDVGAWIRLKYRGRDLFQYRTRNFAFERAVLVIWDAFSGSAASYFDSETYSIFALWASVFKLLGAPYSQKALVVKGEYRVRRGDNQVS